MIKCVAYVCDFMVTTEVFYYYYENRTQGTQIKTKRMKYEVCAIFQIDWPMKLFLANGVVCGMEYLHSILPHPVIHGDLKIQNVLVGDGLVAKVCLILYTDNLSDNFISFIVTPRM